MMGQRRRVRASTGREYYRRGGGRKSVQQTMEAAADVGLLGLGAAWASTATVGKTDDPRSAPIFATVDDLMAWIDRNVELTGTG